MSLQQQLNRFAGKLDPPYDFDALTTGILDDATADAVVKILAFGLQSQLVRHQIAGDSIKASVTKVKLEVLQHKVAADGAVAAVSEMNQHDLAAQIKALADEMKLPMPGSAGSSNRTAMILGVGMAVLGLTVGIAYFVHRQRTQRERGVISGGKPLTTKQIEALKRILRDGRANPFDFGSTTVSRLRKEGLVENDRSTGVNRLVITETGRKLIGS